MTHNRDSLTVLIVHCWIIKFSNRGLTFNVPLILETLSEKNLFVISLWCSSDTASEPHGLTDQGVSERTQQVTTSRSLMVSAGRCYREDHVLLQGG